MSTAVLISGHTRSFARCLPTQLWHVYRKLDDPHFFVSCVEDEQSNDAYLLEGHFPGKVWVETVQQPVLPIPGTNNPAPTDLGTSQRHQLAKHAPYAISSSLQAILRQLWHLERVFQFAREMIEVNGLAVPSVFVRCRPDLWFHELKWKMPVALTVGIGYKPMMYEFRAYLPWWSRCGGCNDRFGIMGADAASHYFGTHVKTESLIADGCPLHPESLLAASLAKGGVDVRNTLLAVFRTLRNDGTTVAPVIYAGEQEALYAALR